MWMGIRLNSGSRPQSPDRLRNKPIIPPHRSVRALLTRTALIGMFGEKPVQRVRVQDCWLRRITVGECLETLPRPSAALTAPPQRKPVPRCFPPERVQPLQVSRHGVMVVVSPHHLCEPVTSLANWIVDASAQFYCDVLQFCRQSLTDRLALYRELAALPDRAPDMLTSGTEESRPYPDNTERASSPAVDQES